ncbi:MAG: aspartate kinase [Bacteroidales bacterium]|nr:aspartate kinase [Bacteroidales bacterium]
MIRNIIKYGGSNLKTPEGTKNLIRIVSSFPDPVIIVVSALSGVTDMLDETVKIPADRDILMPRLDSLRDLYNRHMEQIIPDPLQCRLIAQKMDVRFEELKHLLLSAYHPGLSPDGLYDKILSYGEKLSSLLISEMLASRNIPCREALPEDIGLYTTGVSGYASVDFQTASPNVSKALSEPLHYVIPGFYGIDSNRQIILFGRGGTDYSAAAIARCVGAKSLHIWKDVSGLMTADPRIVPGAASIPRLTYDETAELAYFGARILHPRTVEPLVRKGIRVFIYNSSDENGLLDPVTVISAHKRPNGKVFESVTFSDHFAILNLTGAGIGIKPGILARITTALNNSGINISSVITSHISINLLLELKDIDRAEKTCRTLDLPFVSEIKTMRNISVLALVGQGMVVRHGIASKVFGVLAERGINVYMSSMGASEVTTYLVIDRSRRLEAVEAIHGEFFRAKD